MALPNILKLPNLLNLTTGDVSLPGGKTEEDDANDIETALREAKEEIGLDPSLVDVVTVLEPIVTKVDFLGFFFLHFNVYKILLSVLRKCWQSIPTSLCLTSFVNLALII